MSTPGMIQDGFPTLEQFESMTEQELIAATGYSAGVLAGMRQTRKTDAACKASKPREIPPCPPWCAWPPLHEYDSVLTNSEPFTFIRDHVSDGDRLEVRLIQEEHNAGGDVTLGPIAIDVWLGEGRRCNPAEARDYAAQLLAAADLYERIQLAVCDDSA
jgi:hypothetical protein